MLKLALLRSKFPYLMGGSLVSDENVEVPDEAFLDEGAAYYFVGFQSLNS